ncbi:MAG: hypothetical protein WCA44_08825, partial [Acidobacteriaceae bacterium]
MQHFLKPASRATGAQIVAAQLLQEFLIAVDNAESRASRSFQMGSPCGACWSFRRGIRLSRPFSFQMDLPVTSRKRKTNVIVDRIRNFRLAGITAGSITLSPMSQAEQWPALLKDDDGMLEEIFATLTSRVQGDPYSSDGNYARNLSSLPRGLR